jgi:hypothetical protein
MTDIRPMDFGEILDGSLSIYRRHFGLFLRLSAITLSLPCVLFVYLGARFSFLLNGRPSVNVILVGVLAGVLYYLATLVLTAGAIRVISDSYLGRTPRLREALGLGLSKLGSLLGVGFGKGVVVSMIGLGTILVTTLAIVVARASPAAGVLFVGTSIVGGIWFGAFVLTGYGVTTPVVVLEDLPSSFDAFPRSWALTRGFKRKVLGLCLLTLFLANTLPSLALRGAGAVFLSTLPALGVALTVLGYVLPLILAPIVAAVITLIYYDLRVRREAFDLQMLGEELGIV